MSHLDEGTLHALLDGELDLHEVREIQAHLGTCTACDTRLQAAKDVFGEADRLVAAVQFPGELRRSLAGTEAEAERQEATPEPAPAEARSAPASRRLPDFQPVYDETPPIFMPDNNDWGERRRRFVLAGRWAALLFVAVGAGYLASEMRRNTVVVTRPAAESRLETTRPQTAVVSPEETTPRPDSGATVGNAAAREPARRVTAQPPAPKPAAPAPAPAAESAKVLVSGPEWEMQQAESTAPAPVVANVRNADRDAEMQSGDLPDATREDVRAEAAEALAELDRQRRRDRAAAATAAIDRTRRQPAPTPGASGPASMAPAPAPAPRTLEQRSGIYLRIGLDEAARQLGRPVHVIEGLSPQFMGLVQGGQSAGADDGRPVVRVVYQDSQGRMVLLDQQRIRPGQSWPSGGSHWVVGEIGLYLHGESSPEVLRNFRPRVR